MTLVIGYGNRLRGDDAAGPIVAEQVAAWNRPGVEAIAVQQLTPELAPRVAAVSCVVFVDASVVGRSTPPGLAFVPLDGQPLTETLGHALRPAELIGLTSTAFGTAPPAWLLTIPGECFDHGAPLSPGVEAGVREALLLLEAWFRAGTSNPDQGQAS